MASYLMGAITMRLSRYRRSFKSRFECRWTESGSLPGGGWSSATPPRLCVYWVWLDPFFDGTDPVQIKPNKQDAKIAQAGQANQCAKGGPTISVFGLWTSEDVLAFRYRSGTTWRWRESETFDWENAAECWSFVDLFQTLPDQIKINSLNSAVSRIIWRVCFQC